MKKIILFFGLAFLMSCGSSEEKKKGFEYNRTQKEERQHRAKQIRAQEPQEEIPSRARETICTF